MRSVRREEKNNQTTNKLPIFLRQPLWNFTIGRRELPQGSTEEEWIPGQKLISKTENRPTGFNGTEAQRTTAIEMLAEG